MRGQRKLFAEQVRRDIAEGGSPVTEFHRLVSRNYSWNSQFHEKNLVKSTICL